MKKIIIRVIISLLSVLVVCYLLWVILLSYPSFSYSNKTQFGQVAIFHNHELDEKTGEIITDVIEIIKSSELYDKDRKINLCLNDDRIYPKLYPIDTYAFTLKNTTILKMGECKFNENRVEIYQKEKDVYQVIDLTWLLAHEFTHNLQFNANQDYVKSTTKGKINWKLEGYADYTARKFKNDGRLKGKIDEYLIKYKDKDDRTNVIVYKEGKKLIPKEYMYTYYNKYALLVQYLIEVMDMNYYEICELETDIDKIYADMTEWRGR